jgi:chromosome partitioning protein
MQTIALISQKGGSGKTTLAVHLAVEATRAGRRAILIDLDPQASAARWADRRGERSPDVTSEHPARLVAALEGAAKAGYDLAVLDTAPHADQFAMQSARAADLILVPCQPSILDLDAIGATLDLCALVRRPACVVLNRAPIRSRVVADTGDAVRRLNGRVSGHIIHERVAFRHSLVAGNVAAEYEPAGLAATEIAHLFASLHDGALTYAPVSEVA